jgi:pyruvate dehydrogenase complex dehydrogenase (E1) component
MPARRTCSRRDSTTSSAARSGDLVFYQPHSAPGVYARAFLEGRLTERRPGALPAGTHGRPRRGAGLSQLPRTPG